MIRQVDLIYLRPSPRRRPNFGKARFARARPRDLQAGPLSATCLPRRDKRTQFAPGRGSPENPKCEALNLKRIHNAPDPNRSACVKRTQFRCFWPRNEGAEEKRSQSARAEAHDWGLRIRWGRSAACQTNPICRGREQRMSNKPNSARPKPGNSKSEARNPKRTQPLENEPRNVKRSQSARAEAAIGD